MVRFLLHNTLGAWWAGKILAADPSLAATVADEEALRAASAPSLRRRRTLCRTGLQSPTRSRRPFVMWPKRRRAYILFLVQVLVVSSHVPPAIMQSDSVFASFTSPAKAGPVKAGPVKASARVNAKIERRVFMAFTPLRWT
jgi:hypothetical protein